MNYKISIDVFSNDSKNQPARMSPGCLRLELADNHGGNSKSVEIVGWFRYEGLFSHHLSIVLPLKEAKKCGDFFQEIANSTASE